MQNKPTKIINIFQIFKNIFLREMDFLFFIRRKFLIFCLVFPLATFIILAGVFKNPVLRELPVAFIDNDKTRESKEVLNKIGASEYIDLAYAPSSFEEAKKLVSAGTVYGIVIIPTNFSLDLLSNNGSKVYLQFNNQQFVQGALVKKGVISAVQDFSNKYTIKYMERGDLPYYAARVRAEPLVFNDKVLFNPWFNYQYFFLLGLFPAFIQLFIIGITAYGFYFEFKTGKFAEIAPVIKKAPLTVFFAKSVAYFLLSFFMMLSMLVILFYIIGTPFRNGLWFVMLASALFASASIFTGTVFALILRHSSFSAAVIYAAPAFAYSGITFPSISMPEIAENWSLFLPLHHYHKILINQAIRGGDVALSGSYNDVFYLFVFVTVCFLISITAFIFTANKQSLWGVK